MGEEWGQNGGRIGAEWGQKGGWGNLTSFIHFFTFLHLSLGRCFILFLAYTVQREGAFWLPLNKHS